MRHLSTVITAAAVFFLSVIVFFVLTLSGRSVELTKRLINQKLEIWSQEGLEQAGEDYRMLILPDHPTPVRVRTHTGDPVPYMLYDSTNAVKGQDEYSERTAQKTGIFREKGGE